MNDHKGMPAGIVDAPGSAIRHDESSSRCTVAQSMLEGIRERLVLSLTSPRTFGNGNGMLCCEPTA